MLHRDLYAAILGDNADAKETLRLEADGKVVGMYLPRKTPPNQ